MWTTLCGGGWILIGIQGEGGREARQAGGREERVEVALSYSRWFRKDTAKMLLSVLYR